MTCACRGQFDGYACDQCKCGANGRCNALSGECECDAGYGGAYGFPPASQATPGRNNDDPIVDISPTVPYHSLLCECVFRNIQLQLD